MRLAAINWLIQQVRTANVPRINVPGCDWQAVMHRGAAVRAAVKHSKHRGVAARAAVGDARAAVTHRNAAARAAATGRKRSRQSSCNIGMQLPEHLLQFMFARTGVHEGLSKSVGRFARVFRHATNREYVCACVCTRGMRYGEWQERWGRRNWCHRLVRKREGV